MIGSKRHAIIQSNNILRVIDVAGPNSLDAADINDIIDKVYTSAIQRNAHNGALNVSANYFPGRPLIGPPSPQSEAKLKTLAEDYNWWVPATPTNGKKTR